MINYLAFLGWNPGTEEELFTLDELIGQFSIDKLQKSGAIFDETKMRWFNHEHLKKLSDDEFTQRLTAFAGKRPTPQYLGKIISLLRERSQTLGEALQAIIDGEFAFMEDEVTYAPELLLQGAKVDASVAKQHLQKVLEILEALPHENFTAERAKEAVFPYATEQGRSGVLWPMRVALSGKEKSPDPFALCALLGKEKTLERIAQASHVL